MKLCGIVNNGKNSPRRVYVASATIFLMHPCAPKKDAGASFFVSLLLFQKFNASQQGHFVLLLPDGIQQAHDPQNYHQNIHHTGN